MTSQFFTLPNVMALSIVRTLYNVYQEHYSKTGASHSAVVVGVVGIVGVVFCLPLLGVLTSLQKSKSCELADYY